MARCLVSETELPASFSEPPLLRPMRLEGLRITIDERLLLDDTTLTIPGGKITVIVGGSGAGKSVLLRVLSGLLPRSGSPIAWSGKINLGEQAAVDPRSRRKRVGIVFQQFALFDELSPTANVQFAIDHRSDRKLAPQQSAAAWLEELGVPTAPPVSALSGGQKQRLAIARTLAADPEIILYDEPTSGLDAASGRKVAALIRQTQSAHRRTSIVVTHDYETLIPIADEVLLLDSAAKQLVTVPREDWHHIPGRMQPVAIDVLNPASDPRGTAERFGARLWARSLIGIDAALMTTGRALMTTVKLPIELLPNFPSLRWGIRFLMHFLRLVGGPSAWFYLILAGLIVGFTTTYFTFRFLPFRVYTHPLLLDELLASIGFALYRILVPVLATVLIAARCGAAVAADVGVKQYGGQVDALRTLGVAPRLYLLVPMVLAFMIATPLLEWLAFSAARGISLLTFVANHRDIEPFFWDQHFHRHLKPATTQALGVWPGYSGWGWVLWKNVLCGVGTAVIGYHQGLLPKNSATDVSHSITSTVLWTTLFVLVVHFIVALIEF